MKIAWCFLSILSVCWHQTLSWILKINSVYNTVVRGSCMHISQIPSQAMLLFYIALWTYVRTFAFSDMLHVRWRDSGPLWPSLESTPENYVITNTLALYCGLKGREPKRHNLSIHVTNPCMRIHLMFHVTTVSWRLMDVSDLAYLSML